MGCTPSMLDHKKGHRDSTGSQDQVLGGSKGGSAGCPCEVAAPCTSVKVDAPRTAPRASMDSDGFSVQLSGKKDSYVSQMGNNFTTSLHIKRISDAQSINSGSSGGSPGARLGHRKSSLALTPEDEPLDITNRNATGGGITGGISIPQQCPVKVLNVMFPEKDRVGEALVDGCTRINMEAFPVRQEEAIEACLARMPSLIVIDSRSSKLDAENLCRALRNQKCTQFTVIVAVVKKSHYVKEDFPIVPFLDAGFNRVVVESESPNVWSREVMQLVRGIGRPLAQCGIARALLAALQKCKDMIHVTDEHFRVQYANKVAERVLGWRCEEAAGRTLGEVDTETVNQLNRGRDWEGIFPFRRRAPADTVLLSCRASPVSCDSRTTTHYVFVSEPHSNNSVGVWDVARGSLHSVRRGSLDVRSIGSDGLRRASLAKLQGLPLEAPITKVISWLSSAQEGSNPQTVSLINRAIDLLRTTELYSPQVRDDHRLSTDDPVANDLIGALLSQGPTTVLSSRRSSNDSTVIRTHTSRQNVKHKLQAPSQLQDLLDSSLSWEFDIFKLEELTKKRPLVHLGLKIMGQFDAYGVLGCDEKTIINWLTVIEMNYHTSNTYHNSTHAADVMQAVACYLQTERLQNLLEPTDEIAALIAAVAHDVDHPGTSSAFLCNSRHPLAILYNDMTVLENHHAALTFKLTLNDNRVNIFKNLDRENYKNIRHNVIDMILATEMTKHFEHLAKFVAVYCPKSIGGKDDDIEIDLGVPQLSEINLPSLENISHIKRMMIKCADVSNPSRSLKYCVEWARRIAEEYFLQTDEEKARELPVVMPVFDRATCSIPRSQIGFIDFIINDMMEAWSAFVEMPELMTHTRKNYQYWREMDEQGVTTLQDIKNMQNILGTPTLSIPKSSPE